MEVFTAAESGIDAGPVISVGVTASNWLKSVSVKILMFCPWCVLIQMPYCFDTDT